MMVLRFLVTMLATAMVWVLAQRSSYGTPSDPTASTVITVAYAVANLLNPIRWLRTMTGGSDPPGTGYVVTSDSTSATTWKTLAAVVQAGVGTLDLTLNNTIWLKVKESGGTARGAVRMDGSNNLVIGDANNNAQIVSNALALPASTQVSGNNVWHAGNTDGAVSTAKLADDAVTAAKIIAGAVGTSELADLAVTAAKIAAQTITNAQIANNTIGNSQLVGGTAVDNLGYTPPRYVAGTYSGTGATSARQITTGFAVKFVIIHQPAADVMYVAINTTSSLRLGPSPTFVQGSASVHTHASDGFVVSDGSVQGNVAGSDNYSYTAFG